MGVLRREEWIKNNKNMRPKFWFAYHHGGHSWHKPRGWRWRRRKTACSFTSLVAFLSFFLALRRPCKLVLMASARQLERERERERERRSGMDVVIHPPAYVEYFSLALKACVPTGLSGQGREGIIVYERIRACLSSIQYKTSSFIGLLPIHLKLRLSRLIRGFYIYSK
jgi:hypothetical protein